MHRDDLPIRSCPPHVETEDFSPSGPDSHHCRACNKHVYDLSAMTESAASAFLELNAEALPCLAFTADERGNVVHVRGTRLRRSAHNVLTVGVAVVAAACNAAEPSRPDPPAPTATVAPSATSSGFRTRGIPQRAWPSSTRSDCAVPYTVDERGIKKAKHECLDGRKR